MNSIEEDQEEEQDGTIDLAFQMDNGSVSAAAASSHSTLGHAMRTSEKTPLRGGDDDNDGGDVRIQPEAQGVVLRGVLFGRSIRSSYACLHLYPLVEYNDESSSGDDEDDDSDEIERPSAKPLLVRLQLVEQNESLTSLRSHIRRQFKMGDLLCIERQAPPVTVAVAEAAAAAESAPGAAESAPGAAAASTRTHTTPIATTNEHYPSAKEEDRVILHITSVLEATRHVRVEHYQYWKMSRVQQVQAAHRQFLVGEASYHYKSNNNKSHVSHPNKRKKAAPRRQPPCLHGHDDSSQRQQQHPDLPTPPPQQLLTTMRMAVMVVAVLMVEEEPWKNANWQCTWPTLFYT
jgi:hypothetical protein